MGLLGRIGVEWATWTLRGRCCEEVPRCSCRLTRHARVSHTSACARARARARLSCLREAKTRTYCYGRISRADESLDIHEYISLFKAEPRRPLSGIHDTPAANGKAMECA